MHADDHWHERRSETEERIETAPQDRFSALGLRAADGQQFAMGTVFVRRDGKIHHLWSSELWLVPSEPGQNPRHVDFMWPLWAVLDRTPGGRGSSWMPQLDYSG